MEPYCTIDDQTRHIITELVNKCAEIDLGNINFSYYKDRIDFYLSENNYGWQLVVKQCKKDRSGLYMDFTDIYKIADGEIIYQSSEADLD